MGATTALLATSAIMTAATTYSQYKAQKSEGDYQQSIYSSNARIADLQAEDSIRRGNVEAKDRKLETRKLIGAQRARLAAQGQDLEYGSALQIQEDTAALGALDALEIKNNAWREAWGYKVQASDYTARGELAKITSKNNARNTLLSGGLSVASAVAQGAYSYYGGGKSSPKTVSGVRSDGTRISTTYGRY